MFGKRSCPVCGYKWVPWNLWRVTRWTSIACPSCKVKLNRDYGVQTLAISLLIGVSLTAVFIATNSFDIVAVAIAGVSALAYLVDVASVRLVAQDGRERLGQHDA